MAFQREIKELTDQLCQKENFVKELVSSRDVLHQQLDDKTIRLEDFKKRLLAAENKRVDVEQENTGQLRRVKDCLSEIHELQQKLQVSKNRNYRYNSYNLVKTEIKGDKSPSSIDSFRRNYLFFFEFGKCGNFHIVSALWKFFTS